MKKYLVIERCEDEAYLHYLTEDELQKRLNDGEFRGYEFLKPSDFQGDLMGFPSMSIMIFCGDGVIPKPVKTVTKYKL